MKINGVRCLNDDNYKTLSIIDNTEGINVKVSGEKEDEVLNFNAYALFQNLKGLDDNDAKKQLINYYINSNRLDGISKYFNRKNPLVIKVSSEDKKMKLMSQDLNFVDEEYYEILNKYKKDRERFLKEKDFDIYVVNITKKASCYHSNNINNKNVCYLFLNFDNKAILSEKNFLKKFIEEKIFSKNVLAEVSNEYKYYRKVDIGAEYSFSCGDFIIITDNDRLFELFSKIALNHNKELENVKQLQYKIKGF